MHWWVGKPPRGSPAARFKGECVKKRHAACQGTRQQGSTVVGQTQRCSPAARFRVQFAQEHALTGGAHEFVGGPTESMSTAEGSGIRAGSHADKMKRKRASPHASSICNTALFGHGLTCRLIWTWNRLGASIRFMIRGAIFWKVWFSCGLRCERDMKATLRTGMRGGHTWLGTCCSGEAP